MLLTLALPALALPVPCLHAVVAFVVLPARPEPPAAGQKADASKQTGRSWRRSEYHKRKKTKDCQHRREQQIVMTHLVGRWA